MATPTRSAGEPGAEHWLDDRVTIATPEGVDLHVLVAGIGSRFVARLLDSLIQGAVILALVLIGGVTSAFSTGPAVALFVIAVFIVLFGYDVVFEQAALGATPGKRAAGIRVVGDDGGPVSLSASLVRNVVRLIDFLPALYGIGLVCMLATQHSRRLGDLAAGTLVVRERLGDARHVALQHASAVTVPLDDVLTWDVSGVSGEEVAVVRVFLARRLSLAPEVRYNTAVALAMRLAPKVAGLPATSHPEYVLEGIIVAKDARA